jgi:hypothetical protein
MVMRAVGAQRCDVANKLTVTSSAAGYAALNYDGI